MKASKVIWGFLFVAVGVLCLLSAFDIEILGDDVKWYDFLPLALSVLGLSWLIEGNSKVLGAMFMVLGAYWTLYNFDIVTAKVSKIFLPLIFVAIGVSLIVPYSKKKHERDKSSDTSAIGGNTNNKSASASNVFSESTTHVEGDIFRKGDVVAVFGGSTYDLTGTQIDPAGAHLSATVVFGGIDILVPEGTSVILKGFVVFGGVDQKHKGNGVVNTTNGTLTIATSGAFGGIEIKYV